MKKVKLGVLGARRGRDMIDYCTRSDYAVLTAVCDNSPARLKELEERFTQSGVQVFSDFESFLQADFDAVILANYANDHAPFAIRCLEAGKHVLSEVLPVETLQEAAALVDAAERSSCIYAYGENYCFMPAPYAMRKLYREGRIGAFEYGEGEYMHNCEKDWPDLTYGDPTHWRNRMYSTYYCTHSLGPLLSITGLRPVRVSGFEVPFSERMHRMGAQAGPIGLEIVTLENGGVVKSVHGVGPSENSVWYTVYGSKGRMESAREDAEAGGVDVFYLNRSDMGTKHLDMLRPAYEGNEAGKASHHNGADDLMLDHFVRKILGDETAWIIDVYTALDMFLPGLFAYRSILNGGVPFEIPNLRDPAMRAKIAADTACTNPKKAGDSLLPASPGGDPEIGPEVYQGIRERMKIGF